jgi:hypothetical protein
MFNGGYMPNQAPTQTPAERAHLLSLATKEDVPHTLPNGDICLISARLLEIVKTHPNREAIKKLMGL